MTFNELADSILKEANLDAMSPEERDAYEAELDKKEAYKDYLAGHNSDDEAAYLAAREILDSLKARDPKKYGKIVSALNYLISHNE